MIIKKYKNGRRKIQTTSEQLEKSIKKPTVVPKPVKRKKIVRPSEPINKKPIKKPKRRRGCGCGKR